MRIAIFGAGGVGGYYGGRLAQAGEEVVFLARGEHLRALRDGGLRVESVRGDFTVFPVRATDDPAEVGAVDAVVVAVKAWQVRDAARAMRPMLAPGSCVLPFQNGVEAPAELAAVLGAEPVLVGLAKIFSFVVAPGRIRHIGGPASVAFGEADDRPSERVAALRAAFARAGVAVDTPPDIRAALWEKFLFVVATGAVGAVARAPVGVLRSLPETRGLIERAMAEIRDVARAHGVALPDDAVARAMAFVDGQPAGGTTSLQRDLAAGRPSELEAWGGAVVRLGAERGVPTPLHAVLYHAMLPSELRSRGALEFPG